MRFIYLTATIFFVFNYYLCLASDDLNVSLTEQMPDSLFRKNIDINNRIAEHFIDKEPNLAYYYADSAAVLALENNYLPGLKDAILIKGRISLLRKDYEQAINYFERSIQLADELSSVSDRIRSKIYLSEVYMGLEEYQLALDHLHSAFTHEHINDPLLEAKAYSLSWQVFYKRKETDSMLFYQKKALAVYDQSKNKPELAAQIADGFLKTSDYTQALEYYKYSLDKLEKAGKKVIAAGNLINIGEIYLIQNRINEAKSYFLEARKYFVQMNNKRALLTIDSHMGRCHMKLKNYLPAIESLKEANRMAIDLDDLTARADITKLLAEVYELDERPDQSLIYYKMYLDLKDRIFSEESARRIAEIKANFEFDKKEKEIAFLLGQQKKLSENAKYKDQINSLKTNLLIIFGFAIFLILAIAILLFYRYRANKQDNQLLSEQNLAISQQKTEIEVQSDIISKKNKELQKARNTIVAQNRELSETNEKLEEIIDQRSAELKRTYNKLSFHVDNTPLAVLEWNEKMELIRWSSQAEKIFGWKAKEVLGKHIQHLPLLNKDHKDSIDKTFAELLTGEKPRNFYKNQNYHKDGHILDVEWSNSILFNEDGRLESILSIANNVTIREKAIQDLKKSNEELDNFIYRASHDLRGPITRLLGVVNLGMLESKETVSRKYFDLLGKVTFEMNAMLSRLLTVHDIHTHQLNVQDVSIKTRLKAIIEKFKMKNLAFNMDITYDFPARLKWHTDPFLFKIAMQNLIENAYVKSIDTNPSIIIKARKVNSSYLKITFSDNGRGFPKEVVDRVFDMFFHGSERTNVNYGLSLYLVKKTIEGMGGSIILTKPANDTTFEIILPDLSNMIKANAPGQHSFHQIQF